MQPFTSHTGIVAAMDRANVDTDQIIPKQFLKRIERTGFGQYLFFDWRFHEDGSNNETFELNQPEARGASILLARQNFGSGSSREHAVWALEDYGIRALLAPSFADIFYNNCFKNGLLPIPLPSSDIDELFAMHQREPGFQLTIDLEKCLISNGRGWERTFELEPSRRHNLLHGLDDIALTLQRESKITAYETANRVPSVPSVR